MSEMKWTRVEDEMPEIDKKVIMCSSGGYMQFGCYTDEDIWRISPGDGGRVNKNCVAYWMTFPALPKGDKDE